MAVFYARKRWTVVSDQWSVSGPKGRMIAGTEFRGLKASAPSKFVPQGLKPRACSCGLRHE